MIMPIADDNSDRRTFPVVTITLIAINVAVFFVLQGGGANDRFTYAFSTVPREILTGTDIVTEGRIVEVGEGRMRQRVRMPGLGPSPQPVHLTLLTAMFMHGSLMHLFGNMLFLWIFGDNIEDSLTQPRYIAFYLVCGLLASLAHVFTNTTGDASLVPSLGASGAISGVLGGYILLHPNRRVRVLMGRTLQDVPAWMAIGIWFVFQVVNGLGAFGGGGGGVAYGAHIGGFVAGVALILPFMGGLPPSGGYHRVRSPYDQ